MSTTPFNPLVARFKLREQEVNKTSHGYRRSKKQEAELARRFSGRLIPGSGNGVRKGDVSRRGIVRIEAKTTQAESFRVTRRMVETIQDAASAMGETPVIVIEFLDAKGDPELEVALVPVLFLETLLRDINDG